MAIGYEANASQTNAIAIGAQANVQGYGSTAIGTNLQVAGALSVGIGTEISTQGYHSTAIGHKTTASGTGATALGYRTQAKSYASTVVGHLNQPFPDEDAHTGSWDPAQPLFVIGNGQEISGSVQRGNALVVLKNGNVGIGTGTTKPAKKLVVSGNAEVTGPLTVGQDITVLGKIILTSPAGDIPMFVP